jgi:hypothetical protein
MLAVSASSAESGESVLGAGVATGFDGGIEREMEGRDLSDLEGGEA